MILLFRLVSKAVRAVLTVAVVVAAWLAVGPWALVAVVALLFVPLVRRVVPVWTSLIGGLVLVGLVVLAVVVVPAGRLPIPPGGGLLLAPSYVGHAADAHPIHLNVPQNPSLAPDGTNSMHNDSWGTNSYGVPGPLGHDPQVRTAWYGIEECATLAFDHDGRLVALCGNRSGPVMHLLDPKTMRPTATLHLPKRHSDGTKPWEDLCGGAYFYLDAQGDAVVATTDRSVDVVDTSDLTVKQTYDLSEVVPADDCLIALMPDWNGNTWWVSKQGLVGYVGPDGPPTVLDLKEEIANSVSASQDGLFLVTVDALYELRFKANHKPQVIWRTAYDRGSERKSGQLSQGSGTTPTVLPSGLVAITDNAEPRMHVQFYDAGDGHLVCESAVFDSGHSSSDNSLIAVGRSSVVVENNYGYSSPLSTLLGHETSGGLSRVDESNGTCSVAWTSDEDAPTSVAKVSLATGLVYAYTMRGGWTGVTGWYLTGIDARTGKTAFSVRTGTGSLFNNHYSAVTLGPDGSAYVATLAGMVRVHDAPAG